MRTCQRCGKGPITTQDCDCADYDQYGGQRVGVGYTLERIGYQNSSPTLRDIDAKLDLILKELERLKKK